MNLKDRTNLVAQLELLFVMVKQCETITKEFKNMYIDLDELKEKTKHCISLNGLYKHLLKKED